MKGKGRASSIILGIIFVFVLSAQMAYALLGTKPETGITLKVKKEWKGLHCGYAEPLQLVIGTGNQWEELWRNLCRQRLPEPILPQIDFGKEMVIAVFMGERSSGGYEIKITRVIEMEEEIVVEVEEKKPLPESLQTMASTQPYHIVVIKKSSLPVRFQRP